MSRPVSTPMILAAAILSAISAASAAGQAAPSADLRRVLILHAYHPGHAWTECMHAGVVEALDASGLDIESRVEYMDTGHCFGAAYRERLTALYDEKFSDRRFDVIVCTGDNALRFLLVHRDRLFPKTPVIFCGVAGLDEVGQAGQPLFSGVIERASFAETIEAALALTPRHNHFVIYGDNSPKFYLERARLKAAMGQFEGRATFDLKERYTIGQILGDVRTLPEHAAVLAVCGARDEFGDLVSASRVVRLIAETSDIPIYGCRDTLLGKGIIGGRLVSGRAQGRKAGRAAVKLLEGGRIEDLPVLAESPNQYLFDYEQLARFGAAASALPQPCIIINEPQSLFVRYQRAILATGAVLAALTVFALLLGINILWRKRAQLALAQSEARFRQLVDQAADAIFIFDVEGCLIDVNQQACLSLGLGREQVLALTSRDVFEDEPEDGRNPWESLREQHDVTFESVQHRHDGAAFPVEVRLGRLRLECEDLILAIVRDISERKCVEREREELITELKTALSQVKTLSGLLPICACCKKVRDDTGYWNQIESYLQQHSEATFSHGLCPDCLTKLYPEYAKKRAQSGAS